LKQAEKDKEKIKQYPALKRNVEKLLEVIQLNPYQNPPPYEMLIGNMKGLYSRRINRQHRLVYRVLEDEKVIMIISMWTHYEF
jgi:Txe/YoeB family toxin of toxin-antitoxin system